GHNALATGRHLKAACMARPLSEQRVAVWGAGPVGIAAGRVLATVAEAVAYAAWPSCPADLRRHSAEYLNGWADVHVVALPLRDSTRGAFDGAWLAAVAQRRPVLICTGRVDTLDLPACLKALDAGGLTGLAVDA